jgi:hypothetical protein
MAWNRRELNRGYEPDSYEFLRPPPRPVPNFTDEQLKAYVCKTQYPVYLRIQYVENRHIVFSENFDFDDWPTKTNWKYTAMVALPISHPLLNVATRVVGFNASVVLNEIQFVFGSAGEMKYVARFA